MKILVTALDWGLGHATRTVPVIRYLLSKGHTVVLAGSGRSLMLLHNDFPQLDVVELESFSPRYFRRLPQWLAIAMQTPRFVRCIRREYKQTQTIVKQLNIDAIVSDNRYGVRSDRCQSVLLTHQTAPHIASWAPRWIERLFARALSRYINRFDLCLIPDTAPSPDGLSGDLSDLRYVRCHVKRVGLLSRTDISNVVTISQSIDWLAIISGPEPQRTLFEQAVANFFTHQDGRKIIVRGLPPANLTFAINGIEYHSHCSPLELKALIMSAKNIIARSGYTTLMDLMTLNRRAILVPTHGQAEQEYLARHAAQKFQFTHTTQKDLRKLKIQIES